MGGLSHLTLVKEGREQESHSALEEGKGDEEEEDEEEEAEVEEERYTGDLELQKRLEMIFNRPISSTFPTISEAGGGGGTGADAMSQRRASYLSRQVCVCVCVCV